MPKPKHNTQAGPGTAGGPVREQVLICGLGLRLAHMTLETMQALKQCRTVFHYFLDEQTAAYLRTLCADVRDLGGLSAPDGPAAIADAVLAAAAPGGTVALLYYGHPLVFQEDILIARCRAAKVPYRVLAALSSLDAVLVAVGYPALREGLQVRHADAVSRFAPLQRMSPAVILSLDRLRGPGIAAFVKQLKTVYPPEHRVTLIRCADISGASALRRETELRALGRALKELPAAVRRGASLFIPLVP